ncbi:MAG: hypothetical protein RR444_01770 [Oscillospiraceae bacterium]
MKNRKKAIITIVAVLTAIIGVAVAVGAYLKRKAEDISEKLDYDGDLYYEDDDYYDDDITAPEKANDSFDEIEEDDESLLEKE